jgi:N-carbamoyl-L-amino-acid hydrolase
LNVKGTKSSRPVLNGDILLTQIKQLSEVGLDGSGGRTRLAVSEEEKKGRDLVVGWMKELGLDVRVDKVGNIFGILPGPSGELDNALMLGSHIDTVINAGPYDGCYGVLSGLAVARAFRESGMTPPRPLAVAAFTDEEGVRFQPDMLGSLVYVGGMSLEEGLAAADEDGITLGQALEDIGYAGSEEPGFLIPSEYLELHIEQGPRLDAEGLRIGAVEGVQGISWWRVTIGGKANHAGTTPMNLRHDAGLAAARVICSMREHTLAAGTTLAATGAIAFEPGLINVIPSKATFTVDLRDPDGEKLLLAEKALAECLEKVGRDEGVTVTSEHVASFEPVVFHPELIQKVEDAARRRGIPSMRMVSGAGHDAQMMARVCKTAMIFVPSVEGISHNPAEHTEREDLLLGAELLLDVVMDLLEN